MTILQPQTEGIPLPNPSPVSQPFWDGTARGELLYHRCDTCDHAVFIPSSICRFCGSRSLPSRSRAVPSTAAPTSTRWAVCCMNA